MEPTTEREFLVVMRSQGLIISGMIGVYAASVLCSCIYAYHTLSIHHQPQDTYNEPQYFDYSNMKKILPYTSYTLLPGVVLTTMSLMIMKTCPVVPPQDGIGRALSSDIQRACMKLVDRGNVGRILTNVIVAVS